MYSLSPSHNLEIQNILGQEYDGANNMQGEFNGIQALVLNDCPYAYFVHYFVHHLQLAMEAALKEIILIHQFFTKLPSIVNIVGTLYKHHDELQATQASDIAYVLSIDKLESERGLDQINTLQRARDTRWSSHLKSISSLIKMFNATCIVLFNIIDEGTTASQ